jgi:MFS family permease
VAAANPCDIQSDQKHIGNLYATPAFQRDFGYLYKGEHIISAPWQTGLSMGNPIGQVVGAFFAAYPMEWYGRKKTFGVCVVLTAAFIFIQFFARSLKVLLVGELLGGLVLGTYAVIAPAYASEGQGSNLISKMLLANHLEQSVRLPSVVF